MSELSWWRDRWLRVLLVALFVVAVVVAVGMARHQNSDANKFNTDDFVCQTTNDC